MGVGAEGVPKTSYYDAKFGPGRWQGFMPRLRAAFESAGIELTMEGRTGPTSEAHRVLCHAYDSLGAEAQDALQESLMRAYFAEGRPPCDPGVIRECVREAKLGEPFEADALAPGSDSGRESLAEELGLARARGVRGVPHFIITEESSGRELELSGAQPPEAFLEAFEELGLDVE
mmetsp:Transcript_9406/g.32733  ORF Transcript_9406/g.32733 Transcript_9406/m.32733 type:complete len:175 (+) Transcript_9406:223-747(+)